jgi:cathepsin B
MKTAFVLLALCAVGANAFLDTPVHDSKLIAEINSKATTWTAGPSARFENKTLNDVKTLCGTIMGEKAFKLPEKPGSNYENILADIPSDWDGRTAFPKCADVIGHIRDQSSCGSCWAFGSTEAFNDRRCVKTGDTTLMSPEDTAACCGFLQCFSMGCGGGHPGAAWNWFKSTGVVTGGDFADMGKTDTCLPYSLKPCAHHVNSTKYQPCPSSEYPTPQCAKKCSNTGYSKDYASDKNKAAQSYSLSGVAKIQSDMMQYGSVTGAFTVYADFPSYKSGVYKHVSGSMLGGHAIKIMGWGVENGEDYWLVANSWNEQWGDNGYFKIARGTNECGIEGTISAGQV